jgi:hypothetical protein
VKGRGGLWDFVVGANWHCKGVGAMERAFGRSFVWHGELAFSSHFVHSLDTNPRA